MAAWEYEIAHLPSTRILSEKMLNEHGAEGWQLVAVTLGDSGALGDLRPARAYFMRRADEQPPERYNVPSA